MAKLSIQNDSRVVFKEGQQNLFIKKVLEKKSMTQSTLAKTLQITPRTLSDWIREKYHIPYSASKQLSKLGSITIPEIIEIRDKFWYAKKGAQKGGIAAYQKSAFGKNEKKRLEKWKLWWEKEGRKKSTIIKQKDFVTPKKSEKLAEFFGILLGDGGLTKYQLKISLDKNKDREYALFIEKVINELFSVPTQKKTFPNNNALDIVVSRKGVIDFVIKHGLKTGNKVKNNIKVPSWIIQNKKYSKACLRGLIDTDGCMVLEKHMIKNKVYTYPRLNFVSKCPDLISFVFTTLKMNKFSPINRRGGVSVQLEKKQEICDYFRYIGTSNPKHLNRWLPYALE